MITYENLKIVRVDKENGYYDNKKQKHIPYKKPKIETKVLETYKTCYDLGELYSILKHHAEQNNYCEDLKIEFSFRLDF
tara:strand:+ start:2080 stop:2316 length:237 start_codon:yes stop_codon:yes gene_type:complete